MEGYSAIISESSKPLTAKQKIAVKDFANAIGLDEVTKSGSLVIDIDYFALVEVHNEHSESKDYQKVVIVDKEGTKFTTGSKSLLTSLKDIFREMEGEDEEFQIEVLRKNSKNYSGKQFLTCSIV